MVKFGMVVLTGRENTDVANVDMTVYWMLYTVPGCCWSAGGREGEKNPI
jgi:hypothetical protein